MEIQSYRKRALLLILLLAVLAAGSLLWIVLWGQNTPKGQEGGEAAARVFADVYQDGELLESISLSDLEESYRFTVKGQDDSFNEVEARPGSIGILSASCPDKLCVHQGFISTSLLPITCLPNRLVIQLRVEEPGEKTSDILTH